MHKKRIQKFQNPGGGGIQFTTPGTQNNGFSFLQQLSPYTSLQTSNIGGGSFQSQFPTINADADNGNAMAIKLRFDHSFNEGQSAIKDASTLKNPFTQQAISNINNVVQKPTTFKVDKDGNEKKDFASSKGGKALAIGSQVVGMASQFIPDQDKDINDVDAAMKQARGAGQQALMSSGNPWLVAAGATDMVIDKLGGHSDASEGLGAGNDIGNAIASVALPGAGWFVKKTKKYSMSDELKQSSGYGGLRAQGEKVAKNANAKLLFGASKQNSRRDAQVANENTFLGILNDAKDARQASNYSGLSLGNQIALEGGIRPLRAKDGTKLDKLISARELLKRANIPTVEEITIEVFKEGGKVNVIPGGQLHKNRHHMEDMGDEYKELTTKGIPVVTEGDGGELVQQAEIERDEIIFNIDVTKKLEELMEDGSDEAALEAGKLLAIEIMENTVDNTGLMKEIL